MSETLDAYNEVSKHFLLVDERDDLLYERYAHLLDALWWRLTEEEWRALTKEDVDVSLR